MGNGLDYHLRMAVIRSAMIVAERNHEPLSCPCCSFVFALGESDPNIEVDHILPLTSGGEHDLSNLQVLCFSCNRSKNCRLGASLERTSITRILKCICGRKSFVPPELYNSIVRSGAPHDCKRCAAGARP